MVLEVGLTSQVHHSSRLTKNINRYTGESDGVNCVHFAIEQAVQMASSFINKGPCTDWSTDDNLYSRFKMWNQRCKLLFTGPMAKINEEIQCKHLMYWSGEHRIQQLGSNSRTTQEVKQLLGEI